jgi:putative FmdB family regulatory protein
MPTYEYKCEACGHAFEKMQSMTAPAIRKCPACGKNKVKRLIGTGAGLIFKGSGFYITDYRSEAYKKDSAKSDAAASPTTTAADSTKSGESKPADSTAKPAETKATETKPTATADTKPAKAAESKPKSKMGKETS